MRPVFCSRDAIPAICVYNSWSGFLLVPIACIKKIGEYSTPMSCKVLIVEDEPLSRRNIALYLQSARHNVFQAETGEAAMELMSQVAFDTVISDLRLPGALNGIDVLKHQNSLAPGNRLVLITAFGSDDVQSEAKALGALYLEKPLLLRELLSSIESGNE